MNALVRPWENDPAVAVSDALADLRALHPNGKPASWVMEAPPTMVNAAENFMAERADLRKGRFS